MSVYEKLLEWKAAIAKGYGNPALATHANIEELAKGAGVLVGALNEAVTELDREANQLDKWARESREGGWSTHQVDPMRKRADDLRRVAAVLRERAR